jgi:hypothetical protein
MNLTSEQINYVKSLLPPKYHNDIQEMLKHPEIENLVTQLKNKDILDEKIKNLTGEEKKQALRKKLKSKINFSKNIRKGGKKEN